MNYISEYYQGFVNSVYGQSGDSRGWDPDTGKFYYDYCDLDSLVNTYLLQTIASNSDTFWKSQYFYNPVYWAAENGITVGYADGSFGVGLDCQRRELMIFLWRYAGCPGKGDTVSVYGDARNMFNDLKSYGPTSATNQAIAWAYSEGITKGYSDGGFHPKDSIVRKDVMILLYRLADKPDVSGVLKYPDCKQYKTSSDTYRAILWGSQNGITKGYSSGQYAGQFGAKLNCLREQIVTFLYRFNNL